MGVALCAACAACGMCMHNATHIMASSGGSGGGHRGLLAVEGGAGRLQGPPRRELRHRKRNCSKGPHRWGWHSWDGIFGADGNSGFLPLRTIFLALCTASETRMRHAASAEPGVLGSPGPLWCTRPAAQLGGRKYGGGGGGTCALAGPCWSGAVTVGGREERFRRSRPASRHLRGRHLSAATSELPCCAPAPAFAEDRSSILTEPRLKTSSCG